MASFKHGICGCTDDGKLCMCTWCVPCALPYVTGKTAEAMGKNCCLWGFLSITPLRCITNGMVRAAVREKYQIDGSTVGDICYHFCPFTGCCATVQEAQEVIERGDAPAGALCMTRQ